MPPRVFIGHSSDDVDVAKGLIKLLEGVLGVTRADIRCSSVADYGLEAGAPTEATLQTEVHDAEVFIGIVTPRSLESVYALFELGARWGAGKVLMPLLAGGVTPTTLEEPLSNLHAVDGTRPEAIRGFIRNVAGALKRPEPKQIPESLVSELAAAASVPTRRHHPPGKRTMQWLVGAILAIVAVGVGRGGFKIRFIPENDLAAMCFYGTVTGVAVSWYVVRQTPAIWAVWKRNHNRETIVGIVALAFAPVVLLVFLWLFMAEILGGPTQ